MSINDNFNFETFAAWIAVSLLVCVVIIGGLAQQFIGVAFMLFAVIGIGGGFIVASLDEM